MTSPRSVRMGLVAAAGLSTFYAGVIVWGSGFDHLASQAASDWPYLVAIIAGFGVQVALLAELRQRHRERRREQAAAGMGTGASVVGMVACCAHHLADLVPLAGLTGAAAFLTDWRIGFMLAGIAVNAAGVAIAARRLSRDKRVHQVGKEPSWQAAA